MFFNITSCEYEITTAHIENIKMCTSLESKLCVSDNTLFSPDDPLIYVSCELKNAPDNTEVKIIWKYTEGIDPIIIDEIVLNSSELGINVDLNSNLSRPYNGWPTGAYEVIIIVNGNEEKPLIKCFEVR